MSDQEILSLMKEVTQVPPSSISIVAERKLPELETSFSGKGLEGEHEGKEIESSVTTPLVEIVTFVVSKEGTGKTFQENAKARLVYLLMLDNRIDYTLEIILCTLLAYNKQLKRL